MSAGRRYRIAARISELILDGSPTKFCLSLSDLYTYIMLKEWLIARRIDVNKQHQSSSLKGEQANETRSVNDERCLLADCYLEYWLRQGVNCERYYLIRAKDHYEVVFNINGKQDTKKQDLNDRMRRGSIATPSDFSHHIKYCHVLQYLGEFAQAASFLSEQVLKLSVDDPEYPNHLFCAGVIQKAMNNFEEANEKFFEASQVGPPRFFSKVNRSEISFKNQY